MSVMPKRRELTRGEREDAKRLKAAWLAVKDDMGLSQEQMAFQCGWKTQGAFTHYINGIIPLNLDALLKITSVLKADAKQISPRLTRALDKQTPASKRAHHVAGIPVVGTTQGGPDHQWVETGYPAGFGDEYITMTSRDPHAYALRVRGNSMAPRIREGEVILVEPTTTAEAGDDVVVRTLDGQVMVKTLVSTRNGETILDSIAKDYDRIVLRQEKIEWIHPVMGVIPARSILKR